MVCGARVEEAPPYWVFMDHSAYRQCPPTPNLIPGFVHRSTNREEKQRQIVSVLERENRPEMPHAKLLSQTAFPEPFAHVSRAHSSRRKPSALTASRIVITKCCWSTSCSKYHTEHIPSPSAHTSTSLRDTPCRLEAVACGAGWPSSGPTKG